MSAPEALIIVPTHDHARLLPHALQSAQEQTIENITITVIGDGVRDDTRDAIAPILKGDPRVRFVDLPKAGRTGEPHRHLVVSETRAPLVGYLGDDDLLAPDHVVTMVEALRDADVALSVNTFVDPDGRLHCAAIDLRDPRWIQLAQGGVPVVSLTGMTHTTDAYRRLPEGWTTTPDGWSTDQYMLLKFVDQPGCRLARPDRVTTLKFASAERPLMTPEQRETELLDWVARLRSSGWAALRNEACRAFARDASTHLIISIHARRAKEELEAELAALRATRTMRARDRILRLRAIEKLLAQRHEHR